MHPLKLSNSFAINYVALNLSVTWPPYVHPPSAISPHHFTQLDFCLRNVGGLESTTSASSPLMILKHGLRTDIVDF